MIDDPAEALDILLEELKRQKAAGVRRVSITADSLTALKALAGTPTAPVAQATPAPAKPAAASAPALSQYGSDSISVVLKMRPAIDVRRHASLIAAL